MYYEQVEGSICKVVEYNGKVRGCCVRLTHTKILQLTCIIFLILQTSPYLLGHGLIQTGPAWTKLEKLHMLYVCV